jgi:hypothetical protein
MCFCFVLLGPFNETNTSYYKASVGGYHAVKLRRYDDLINHYFYAEDSVKSAQIPQILNLLNTKYVVGGTLEQPQVQINPNANGNAWLRIRGNEKPCNQCVNRDLCPSISNYELVIGKNNLCNIPIE